MQRVSNCRLIVMSLYHVLPSNTSPETFPKNHASQYSTPIENEYHLSGRWQVAITSMTHGNCVSTFNNDTIAITKETTDIKEYNGGVLSYFPNAPKKFGGSFKSDLILPIIYDNINKVFKNYLHVESRRYGKKNWRRMYIKILDPNFICVLSPHIAGYLRMNDVITMDDWKPYSHYPIEHFFLFNIDDYISLLPKSSITQTINIKREKEELSPEEICRRFNARLNGVAKLLYQNEKFSLSKPVGSVKTAIVLSPKFARSLGLRNMGMCVYYQPLQGEPHFNNQYSEEWNVDIYDTTAEPWYEMKTVKRFLTLEDKLFTSRQHAVDYLNDVCKPWNITFGLIKDEKVTMTLNDDITVVEFSDDLCDILAFNKSKFSGKLTFTAEDTLSLTRRIDYLYVYSNVCSLTRIGDTEAPLLTVIPFNPKSCKLMSEKVFKVPMYVDVSQTTIPVIDVEIRDGAGQLVPFHKDSVTTLRLHFKQV